MKLRKRDTSATRRSAGEGGSGKRRKRGKKAADDVWYHNVSPIFEEPISDDFLGLVSSPEGEERPYEEPSVQVTVERSGPPIAPPEEVAPGAAAYGPADGPGTDPARYVGAWSEGLGGAHSQPVEVAPDDAGTMPAAEIWAEHGFVGGAPAGSLDAPPWAMEPPGVPGAVSAPLEPAGPPWTEPAAEQSIAAEAPPETAAPATESSVHFEAPPEPARWQPEPSFQPEPPPGRAAGAAATVCL